MFNVDFSAADLLDSITNEQLISLVLALGSPLLGKGLKHWTGPNIIGLNGESLPDYGLDLCCSQSLNDPAHPTRLRTKL